MSGARNELDLLNAFRMAGVLFNALLGYEALVSLVPWCGVGSQSGRRRTPWATLIVPFRPCRTVEYGLGLKTSS